MNRTIFLTLLRKEIREFMRTYRFSIGLCVFIVLAALAPVGAKFLPQFLSTVGKSQGITIHLPATTAVDSLVQYVRNVAQISAVAVILLSMGSISVESDQGTAEFLFVKPVPRGVFVLAKLVAIWVLLALTLAISAFICGAATFLFFGRLPVVEYVEMNALLLAYLAVITALAIMTSALFASQAAASITAAAVWIGLVLLARVEDVGPYSPEVLVTRATDVAQAHIAIASYFDASRPFIGSGVVILVSVLVAIAAVRGWEP